MEEDHKNRNSSLNFLMDHFEKRLVMESPTYLPSNAAEAVGPFLNGIEILGKIYESKKQDEVKRAFEKFDKDGSGVIDLQELGELSKDLGYPLTKGQLDTAFKDLDLNHDGVIDFEEFCRWYFTGMKPFSGAKRSMLQVAQKTSTIFEALKKENISNILHKDERVTKHDLTLTLNNPPDGQHIHVKANILGPQTAKFSNDCS